MWANPKAVMKWDYRGHQVKIKALNINCSSHSKKTGSFPFPFPCCALYMIHALNLHKFSVLVVMSPPRPGSCPLILCKMHATDGAVKKKKQQQNSVNFSLFSGNTEKQSRIMWWNKGTFLPIPALQLLPMINPTGHRSTINIWCHQSLLLSVSH